MGAQDTFAVVSLKPHPQVLLAGDSRQEMQAVLALDKLVPGATGLDLPAALTLANGLVDTPGRQSQIIVLTDGSYVLHDDPLPPVSAPVTWQLIPAGAGGESNQAVLNVSAGTLPDGRHRLFGRVVNFGDAPVTRTVRVSTGAGVFDETTVRLAAQGEIDRMWTLPAQAETVAVEIVEPDILPLDNRAELLLTGTARRRVLLISETSDEPLAQPLARALEVQPGVELTVAGPEAVQPNPAGYDLLVFDGPPRRSHGLAGRPSAGGQPTAGAFAADGAALCSRCAPGPGPRLGAAHRGWTCPGVYFDRVPQLALPNWGRGRFDGR